MTFQFERDLSAQPAPKLLAALLVACLPLAACSDDEGPTNTGDAGTDAQTDSTTPDGGTPDGTVDGNIPDAGTDTISGLLDGLTVDTSWADVSAETKSALEAFAQVDHAAFAAEWGVDGLAAKEEALFESPTDEMITQFDAWFASVFGPQSPADFVASTDIVSAELQYAVLQLYLAQYGAWGYAILYAGAPNDLTWDGVNKIGHNPLADGVASENLKSYGAAIRTDLEDLSGLNEVDSAIAEKASYLARQIQHGTREFAGYGVDVNFASYAAFNFNAGAAFIFFEFPELVGDHEAFLRLANALWWFEPTFVSEATAALINDFLVPIILDPGFFMFALDDEIAGTHAYLLAKWWVERLNAMPEAATECTSFTDTERADMMDSFSADLLFNNAGTVTFDDLRSDLASSGSDLTSFYRDAAKAALDNVFPDNAVINMAARNAVKSAVDGATGFGAVIATVLATLDSETGATDASAAFQAALDGLESAGGGYAEDAEVPTAPDEAYVQARWDDVRAFLVSEYGGRVVDVDALLPADVNVNVGPGVAAAPDGTIEAGVGRARSRGEWVIVLAHEGLHSLQAGADLLVEGPATEGAAVHAENTVGRAALDALVPVGDLPLYVLQSVAVDARRYGISMATLDVLGRNSCAGDVPSDMQLAYDTAVSWGMTPDAAEEARVRAAFGTQFLGYLTGQAAYANTVAYFEQAIAPLTDNGIDAYDLLTCGMPSPPLTPAAAGTLQTCLGL